MARHLAHSPSLRGKVDFFVTQKDQAHRPDVIVRMNFSVKCERLHRFIFFFFCCICSVCVDDGKKIHIPYKLVQVNGRRIIMKRNGMMHSLLCHACTNCIRISRGFSHVEMEKLSSICYFLYIYGNCRTRTVYEFIERTYPDLNNV